jgi:Protein of unknown function (DUF2510)
VHVSSGWYPDPSQPGIERYWDGSGWTDVRPVRLGIPAPSTVGFELPSHEVLAQMGAGTALDSTGRGKRAGSRRRALKALSVVVGAAVAAAGSLVIVDRHSDANAAVAAAANSALAGGSADVTLTGSGSAAGNTFSMTGTGSIDFAHGAMQMSVDLTEGAQQLSGQVIYENKMIYVNLGSVINEIDPGKSWVSMSPGQLTSPGGASSLGSFNASGSDPAAALRTLRQEGNAVTGLGPSTVDGTRVEGYSVRVINPDLDYKVYVDRTGQLVQLSTDVNDTLAGQSVRETDTFDFSSYGAPVSVTAPPAGEVVPFAGFLNAARALSPHIGSMD